MATEQTQDGLRDSPFKGLLSDGLDGPGPHPCAGNTWVERTQLGPYCQDRGTDDLERSTSGLAARPGALLLDYLRARLPDDRETWTALGDWLGSMTQRAGGWHGWYDCSAEVLDKGLVAWCKDRSRAEVWGILVDLPGRACASLGDRLLPFLEWVLAHGHITRADFAMDDREGVLSFQRVAGAVRAGALVSRWQERNVIENCGKAGGWTVYLGSRSGQSMIRVYDKASEQGKPGPWVRVELEARGKFGDALSRAYFQRGAVAIVEQVNRRVRFTEPGTDGNKRRAVPALWWAAFLGSVKPGASLMVGELPECTISALAQFIERQAGPALATLLRADGGDLSRLFGIVGRSEARLKPKHLAALAMAGAGVSHD